MSKDFSLPPHPVLKEYYDDAAGRRASVRRLFDASAPYYDGINTVMSFGTGANYRAQALQRAGLQLGQRAVDVGCGTGVLAKLEMDIVGPNGTAIGLDPSPGMLSKARERGVAQTLVARAERLPLSSNNMDFLSMGYALRHVDDLATAFDEYFRVLKPGGTVMLLEIAPPRSRAGYYAVKFYMKYLVPFATRILTRNPSARTLMSYYWETIEQCVAPALILEALRKTGFVDVKRHVVFGIFGEYTARKPDAS